MGNPSGDPDLTVSDRTLFSVLIVDDDLLACEALRQYLGMDPQLSLAGVCHDGAEAVEFVAQHHVDVVVMDVRMPSIDGITASRTILASHPDIKVVMLTSFDDDQLIADAVRLGASGFLLKDSSPTVFGDAIRAAAKGVTVFSRPPTGVERPSLSPEQAIPELSRREGQILSLLCEGQTNRRIARALSLSESSIKAYLTSLMTKMGVQSRTEAVIRAHALGINVKADS